MAFDPLQNLDERRRQNVIFDRLVHVQQFFQDQNLFLGLFVFAFF
jgi:hypothetical protein